MNTEVFPPNFIVYRNNRDNHGGGVLLLVHQSLYSIPADITRASREMVWPKIFLSRGECLTAGYRPPSSTAQLFISLYNALSVVAPGYVALGGDSNLPDVPWRDQRTVKFIVAPCHILKHY